MSPELIDAGKWLGGILVAVCGWLMQRNVMRVDDELKGKASKEDMSREIERLEMRLQETHEARERDRVDMERASAEWRNQFAESIRDRLSSMERNMDAKLDMILEFVRQARK